MQDQVLRRGVPDAGQAREPELRGVPMLILNPEGWCKIGGWWWWCRWPADAQHPSKNRCRPHWTRVEIAAGVRHVKDVERSK